MVRRLRGLIVAPTRDLAQQVFDVLCLLGPEVGLYCGLVAGRETIKMEAAMLVGADGRSGVDVVVATPGRLMSHMQSTQGFTLQDLRFLVGGSLLALRSPSSSPFSTSCHHLFPPPPPPPPPLATTSATTSRGLTPSSSLSDSSPSPSQPPPPTSSPSIL